MFNMQDEHAEYRYNKVHALYVCITISLRLLLNLLSSVLQKLRKRTNS